MKDYNFVDVRDTLMDHNDEYIYYKTDHHWTSAGACLAYDVWSERTGGEAETEDGLVKNVVSDKFRGACIQKFWMPIRPMMKSGHMDYRKMRLLAAKTVL